MLNFYFHLLTTYDILRQKGVPPGKADYMHKGHIDPMSGRDRNPDSLRIRGQ
ncbi:MAG: hypothetical protein CMN56_03425 [Sneathiella sp.]|nr:hypothetical protein [Sneathiella sp.]